MTVADELFDAAETGDLAKVGAIVKQKRDLVHERDNNKKTPLHYVCREGHVDIVQFLLDNRAEVNVKDFDDHTPLRYACWEGHLDVAKLLLQKGAYVNCKDIYEKTPLHEACQHGNLAVVRFLLLDEQKAYVNPKDHNGWTPLHFACRQQGARLELIQCLLSKGANVHAKTSSGETPLGLLNGYNKNNPAYRAIKVLLEEAAARPMPAATTTTPPPATAGSKPPAPPPSPSSFPTERTVATLPTKEQARRLHQLLPPSAAAAAAASQQQEPNEDKAATSTATAPPAAIASLAAGGGGSSWNKTPDQLFLTSPIFGNNDRQHVIGAFVKQLETEAAKTTMRKNATTDVNALRALGYCKDHGIQVEQDSNRALDLYLWADRIIANKKSHYQSGWRSFWRRSPSSSSSSSSSEFVTTAAWLHKIEDPRVFRFGTYAELDHRIKRLRRQVEAAKSSIDVGVLKEATLAKKEAALLEALLLFGSGPSSSFVEAAPFRSLENLQEEIDSLQQKAEKIDDVEEKIPVAEKIQELQERCQREEEAQQRLQKEAVAAAATAPSFVASAPTSTPPRPIGTAGSETAPSSSLVPPMVMAAPVFDLNTPTDHQEANM